MKYSSIARGVVNVINYLKTPKLCEGCRGAFRFASHASNTTLSKETSLQYSEDEKSRILSVLNGSSVNPLTGYDLSKQRVLNLECVRRANGDFGSVEQVLTVPGIGFRCLERLCSSILNENVSTDSVQDGKKKRKTYNRTALLTPTISSDRIKDLNMVIGIHLGIDMVSWAGISREGTLEHWDIHKIYSEPRKIHPAVVLNTAIELCRVLPESDVYVLEDASTGSKTQQQQITALSMQLHKSQLSAMAMALLNTRDASAAADDEWPTNHNRVHYLRSFAAAKLFGTLVGSERVSAQSVVEEIIASADADSEHLAYTPIAVGWEMQAMFKAKEATVRENMGQALMLSMAFYDLIVNCKAQSLALVNAR